MIKKTSLIPLVLTIFCLSAPTYAESFDSCAVEVAVATPPVMTNDSVAFNVVSETGVSRSVTLSKGSGPKLLDKIPCLDTPYRVTATSYSHQTDDPLNGIGQCSLKAGAVLLRAPGSSISVVYPYDFNC